MPTNTDEEDPVAYCIAVRWTINPGEEQRVRELAESMLALQGARSVSLGTQTPVADIFKAVQAHDIQVVALSFSVSMKPKHVVGGLSELRQLLPGSVEIWVGGHNPALKRCAQAGLLVLRGLDQITAEVHRWRSKPAA
jgi:hypothetical protein